MEDTPVGEIHGFLFGAWPKLRKHEILAWQQDTVFIKVKDI